MNANPCSAPLAMPGPERGPEKAQLVNAIQDVEAIATEALDRISVLAKSCIDQLNKPAPSITATVTLLLLLEELADAGMNHIGGRIETTRRSVRGEVH